MFVPDLVPFGEIFTEDFIRIGLAEIHCEKRVEILRRGFKDSFEFFSV